MAEIAPVANSDQHVIYIPRLTPLRFLYDHLPALKVFGAAVICGKFAVDIAESCGMTHTASMATISLLWNIPVPYLMYQKLPEYGKETLRNSKLEAIVMHTVSTAVSIDIINTVASIGVSTTLDYASIAAEFVGFAALIGSGG